MIKGAKIIYQAYSNDGESSVKPTDYDTDSQSEYTVSLANTYATSTDKDKIVYAEQDYFLLDGTFVFPVDGVTYDVGWESDDISTSDGQLTTYIEYIFGEELNSLAVNLFFSETSIPKNFTITYYLDDEIVYAVEVTDNEKSEYTENTSVVGWNKVRITFTKIKGYQRARLLVINFYPIITLTNDEIIDVTASRKTDITGDYSNCGEVSFNFYNDIYDFIETERDLSIDLRSELKIEVYFLYDTSTDYELFGTYYSDSISVGENGKVIKIEGYDILYLLNETNYTRGIVYPNGQSLTEYAKEVAESADITLNVDSAFDDITSTGYITEVSHREALRLIAEAGNGIITVSPDNTVNLLPVTRERVTTYTEDYIVDDMWTISNDDNTLGLNVTKYTLSAATSTSELGYVEEVLVTGELTSTEITYSSYPADVDSVQVFIDTTSNVVVCDSNGDELTPSSGAYTVPDTYSDKLVIYLKTSTGEEDTTFITVTGKAYNTATTEVTQGSTTKNIKEISDNYLLTGDLAQSVAETQYEILAGQFTHNVEVMNYVTVDNLLGNVVMLTKNDIFVTGVEISVEYGKQEFTLYGVDIDGATISTLYEENTVPESGVYYIFAILTGTTSDSDNPIKMNAGESATLYFTADNGYTLPDSITVTGATLDSWDKGTGTAIISNPTDTVKIIIISSEGSSFNGYTVTFIDTYNDYSDIKKYTITFIDTQGDT